MRAPVADRVGIVKGTVTYQERIALPPDAVVEVWITDVSPPILGLLPLAEATVDPEGRQGPLPFELRYDPDRVDPKRDYVVKAAILSDREILFQTEATTPVITRGHPREVALWVVRSDNTEAVR
ncbi:MAG TPA: YbaY family lipoprotein [Candidatus Eisenbacteria bacterium]|nr:YbaY family lipoprotein [Candidatus Eisenbacteria bacterium]